MYNCIRGAIVSVLCENSTKTNRLFRHRKINSVYIFYLRRFWLALTRTRLYIRIRYGHTDWQLRLYTVSGKSTFSRSPKQINNYNNSNNNNIVVNAPEVYVRPAAKAAASSSQFSPQRNRTRPVIFRKGQRQRPEQKKTHPSRKSAQVS